MDQCQETGGELFRAEQGRHADRVNQLRFIGALSFLGLFVFLRVALHRSNWATNFPLFFAYCIAAGLVWAVGWREPRVRPALGLAVAAIDMPAIYFIQLSTFPYSNASGVAGFNVGIYGFLLVLAAFTLDRGPLAFTTAVGACLEGRLQYLAGVDHGAIVAAAILLTLSAMISAYSRNRLRDLLTRLAAIAREEHGLRALAETTREQSYLDSLTGLHNRLGFVTLGSRQLGGAVRTGVHYIVVFLDLDGLKVINDELGHAKGDEAIVTAAKVLRATLRETDLIARLGGDEFVALAVDPLEASGGGSRLAQRITDSLVKFNASSLRDYRVQMSIGTVAFDPKHPASLEQLMAEADKEMYAQKKKRPSRRHAQVLTIPRTVIDSQRPGRPSLPSMH